MTTEHVMEHKKSPRFFNSFSNYFQIDRYDLIKIGFIGFAYFFILASYSILRSLKTSIFLGLVGAEYQPYTRFVAIAIMFPYMFFYSKMVDTLKRRHIVGIILGGYGIVSILFAIIFAHPTLGLRNTMMGPHRILGWAFEIFMDLYSAVILSTFWSFINSICTPLFANRYYGVIVGAGKLGGVLSPILGYWIVTVMTDWQSSSLLTLLSGVFLIAAIILVYISLRKVPHAYMQGYSAVVNPSKVIIDDQTKKSLRTSFVIGLKKYFEGLRLMIAEPYVFGIFWLMYSVEIISIIFDYQMQVLLAASTNNNIADMSLFMLQYTSTFQAVGFVFACFGTSSLLKRIGIRACLMIMPLTIIGLIAALIVHPSLSVIFIVMVILRSLNYGFDFPIREMLYIPTVKDIQFKSKAWSDSFGKTLAKTSGSVFNLFSRSSYATCFFLNFITLGITSAYLVTAFFVGRKYIKTINDGDIIGGKPEEPLS